MKVTPEALGEALQTVLGRVVDKAARSEKVLLSGATAGARIIKQRTADGLDKDGNAFAAYAEKYAEFRRKKGRGTTPNLIFSGKMVNDIAVKTEPGKGVIYFKGGRDPASGDIASYHVEGNEHLPVRDLWGIDGRPEDVKEIRDAIERAMREELRTEGP